MVGQKVGPVGTEDEEDEDDGDVEDDEDEEEVAEEDEVGAEVVVVGLADRWDDPQPATAIEKVSPKMTAVRFTQPPNAVGLPHPRLATSAGCSGGGP